MKAVTLTTAWLLAIAAPLLAQEAPQIYKPGGDVVAPKLVKEVKPVYPRDAMSSRVNGGVKLECVVQADGTVTDVRVVEPLFPSIDDEAVRVVKQWTFSPGTKLGKPVPVMVEVEMTFTMQSGPRLDSADVFKPGPTITAPKKLEGSNASYTPKALHAGIQGTVLVECVVLDNGRVGDMRVSKSLDPELDAEAMRALRQWRFTPGERGGRPVPVQVSIEMDFRLR